MRYVYGPFYARMCEGPSNYLCLYLWHYSRFGPIHSHFILYWHQTPISDHNGADSRLPHHILMRGWIVEGKTLFPFLAPCSPPKDKQLTFGLTHSTLISAKYFAVPLFRAINLISEGISHLAIIFWTIKPVSEEWGLSGGAFQCQLRGTASLNVWYSVSKWAIVVGGQPTLR